jgi:serine/threonine protein kinase
VALAPGTRRDPYEVLALFDAGGMGEVYRAGHTRLERTVALKILAPQTAGDSTRRPTGVRSLEAGTAASLFAAIPTTLTPPGLERVVERCLAGHPDDRWDTARDGADELRGLSHSGSSPSTVASAPRRRWGAPLGTSPGPLHP